MSTPGKRIIHSDFQGLSRMIAMLSSKLVVKVGVFGSKGTRMQISETKRTKAGTRAKTKTESSLTNAEVGAIHEFGSVSRGIPARSFLRMPIHRRAGTLIKRFSVIFRAAVVKGKMTEALRLFGIACENEIQRAFETRGFGTWAPNAASTVAKKGSDAPLIDSAQLRRAIDSQVGAPS